MNWDGGGGGGEVRKARVVGGSGKVLKGERE